MLVPTHIAGPFVIAFGNSRHRSRLNPARLSSAPNSRVPGGHTALVFRHVSRQSTTTFRQTKHVEVFAKSNAAIRVRHLLRRAIQRNGRERRWGLISAIDHSACAMYLASPGDFLITEPPYRAE